MVAHGTGDWSYITYKGNLYLVMAHKDKPSFPISDSNHTFYVTLMTGGGKEVPDCMVTTGMFLKNGLPVYQSQSIQTLIEEPTFDNKGTSNYYSR